MLASAARRIDPYVQHLVRHQALGLTLESEKPVKFRFQQGERATNSKLDHAAIAKLVQEAAPRSAIEQLTLAGKASFDYEGPSGTRVQVSVDAQTKGRWRVVITPAASAAADEDDSLELDLGSPSPGQAVPAARPRGAAVAAGGTLVSGRAPARPPAPDGVPPSPPQVAAGTALAAAAPAISDAPQPSPPEALAAPVSGTVPVDVEGAVQPARPIPRLKGEPRINRYLRRMLELGASDLHFCAGEVPIVRIDGEMRPLEKGQARLTDEQVRSVLYEIITPRAKHQFESRSDADFAHAIEGLSRFRANYFADRRGMGGVFRQIPFRIVPPEKLGLPKQVLDLCWLSKGLVVVTGPTGSGKSTTLATLVDYINRNRHDHIVTIEDPIEFVHDNKKCLVNQREVGAHTATFKNALRAALREDPDIVLVGEMRDLETISIAIETAETGHLVFGTLHTTTAPSTVDRVIEQFPPDQQNQIRTMLSESLKGIIAQVLCKKQGGGRAAAFEVLIANAAVANLIREAKTYQLTSIMQTGRKSGMQTMNDHLLELVRSKTVAPKEAFIKSNDKAVFREMLEREGIRLQLDK